MIGTWFDSESGVQRDSTRLHAFSYCLRPENGGDFYSLFEPDFGLVAIQEVQRR